MELKTLKDFEFEMRSSDGNKIKRNLSDLKAEAVKDIKAVKQGKLAPDDVIEYIKWKFNLNEEELKWN